MLRNLKDKLYKLMVLSPQTITADTNCASVDTKNINNLGWLVMVAAFSFTGSNKIDLKVQESDDNSSWTDAGADALYATDGAGAPIAKSLDATADGDTSHLVEYRGNKRYARLVLDVTGTVSVAMSVEAISTDPEFNPPL